MILFERESAVGNLGVGGPAVEASQGRGNESLRLRRRLPCCQSKWRAPLAEAARSSAVKPVSSILPLASNVPPEKRRPSNWPRAGGLSLSNWASKRVGGLVFGGGGGVVRAGSVDAAAEQGGVEGGDLGSVGKRGDRVAAGWWSVTGPRMRDSALTVPSRLGQAGAAVGRRR